MLQPQYYTCILINILLKPSCDKTTTKFNVLSCLSFAEFK